jgi:Zn-finger nucleic acid-binding protein
MGYDFAAMLTSLLMRSGPREPQFKKSKRTKPIDKLTDEEVRLLKLISLQLENENKEQSTRKCPECNRNFSLIEIKDIIIDGCSFCKSLWFDFCELKEITGEFKDVPSDNVKNRNSKYECPVCQVQMKEYIYKIPGNLLVDQCEYDHGVYLEGGEIMRVFLAT